MVSLLVALKNNFGLLALLVAIPAGQGLYNTYMSYKLSHSSQDKHMPSEERSSHTLHLSRIMLLIAFILLLVFCCIGFLLGVQGPNILALIVGSVLISPLYAISLSFAMRPRQRKSL